MVNHSVGGPKRMPLYVNESSPDEDDLPDFSKRRKQNQRFLKIKFAELHQTKEKLDEIVKDEITKKTLKRKRSPTKVKFDTAPRKSARLNSKTPIDFKTLYLDKEKKTLGNPKQQTVFNFRAKQDSYDLSGINKMLSDNPPDFFGFPKNDRYSDYANELKKIIARFDNVPKRKPITQKMLNNISYRSTKKKYDRENGTTCHQCRQKTTDTKSNCHWPLCTGVRGQFCGFCLKNRYGETLKKVLLNPNWKCPCCRRVCNCSICRTKEGKVPTGCMATTAKTKGYKSVLHMLMQEGDDHKRSTKNLVLQKTTSDENVEHMPKDLELLLNKTSGKETINKCYVALDRREVSNYFQALRNT